jgi:hypothetical protein
MKAWLYYTSKELERGTSIEIDSMESLMALIRDKSLAEWGNAVVISPPATEQKYYGRAKDIVPTDIDLLIEIYDERRE